MDERARVVTCDEAARLLGVSRDTLATWTGQFGYPRRSCSPEGASVYAYEELVALREALTNECSIVSAVRSAQRKCA